VELYAHVFGASGEYNIYYFVLLLWSADKLNKQIHIYIFIRGKYYKFFKLQMLSDKNGRNCLRNNIISATFIARNSRDLRTYIILLYDAFNMIFTRFSIISTTPLSIHH
jgi:hypothetical protein